MQLTSAFEDFMNRTLAAIPGTLRRVEYCSEHRDKGGQYQHWGLCKVHGELQAQRAMAEAHQQVFLETLRTPLAAILEDAARTGLSSTQLADFRARWDKLIPADLGGGSALHFRTVLDALDALARAAHDENRPDASRSQPLAQ